MKQVSAILMAIALILGPILIFNGSEQVGAANDPVQPPAGGTVEVYGDWNVTDTREYINCTIILTGNLNIQIMGDLTLRNVTLVMNCTYAGQYNINVNIGGSISIIDYDMSAATSHDYSNITSSDHPNIYGYVDASFQCTVAAGAEILLRNSNIFGCGRGYDDGFNIDSSAVTVENCNFWACREGLVFENSGGHTIVNCTFNRVIYKGITFDTYGSNLVDECKFINCDRGIYAVYGSNGNVIQNCLFSGAQGGISISSCISNSLINNTFNNNAIAISVYGGVANEYNHIVGTDNKVNGKDVKYYYGLSNTNLYLGDIGHLTLANCFNIKVYDTRIDNGDPIQVAFSTATLLENITLMNNEGGITLRSNGVTIRNSLIDNIESRAISGSGVQNINIQDCTLKSDYYGNETYAEGIMFYQSTAISITDTSIRGFGTGVFFSDTTNSLIDNVVLVENNAGIRFDGDGCTLQNSEICNNLIGITFHYSTAQLVANTILGNGDYAIYSYEQVIIQGNYWGTPDSTVISNMNYRVTVQNPLLSDPNNLNCHVVDTNQTFTGDIVLDIPILVNGDLQINNANLTLINNTGYNFIHSNNNIKIDNSTINSPTGRYTICNVKSSSIRIYNLITTSLRSICLQSDSNIIQCSNISNGLAGVIILKNAEYNLILNNDFLNNREEVISFNGDYNIANGNNLLFNGGVIGQGPHYPSIGCGDSSNNEVLNNNIILVCNVGISLDYSTHNTLENNYIYFTNETYGFYGISLWDGDDNVIISNTIINAPMYGIYSYRNSDNNQYIDNDLLNCPIGFCTDGGVNNTYLGNKISESEQAALWILYHTSGLVLNNNISDNEILGGEYGIFLSGAQDCKVFNNRVRECEYGIFTGDWMMSQDITICNNYVADSTKCGIIIEDNGQGCLVYHNTFVNNFIQASDNGTNNQWHNGYPSGGNYWSDYTGNDVKSGVNQDQPGSDGIGDTPYFNIQGTANKNDTYPLMEPIPIYQEPVIDLITPNGGEIWQVGSFHDITWTMNSSWTQVPDLSVTLDFSTDGGLTFPYNIITNQTGYGMNASYDWQVPDTPTQNAIVRLTVCDSVSNEVTDQSDSVFTILGNLPFVNIISPNGGEALMGNGSWYVSWLACPGSFPLTTNPITIEYSISGSGGPWIQLSSNEENDGQYEWNPVPFINAFDCYLKISVEDIEGFTSWDISNYSFIIDSTKPSPAFNARAELANTDVMIYWNSSPSSDVGHYEIYYIQNIWDPTGDSYVFLANTGLLTCYHHINVGVNNPQTYFYQIRTYDVAGNEIRTQTQAAKLGSTQSIFTNPSGWFMLGSFLVQSNTSFKHVIQSLGVPSKYDYVQLYDPFDSADPWKSYSTTRPPSTNDLTDILYTQGFWVHITTNARFCTAGFVPNVAIPLIAGWNLVPYPFAQRMMTTGDIESHLTAYCPNYDSMMIADYGAPYRLKSPIGIENLMHGAALWVKVTSDTSWTVMNY